MRFFAALITAVFYCIAGPIFMLIAWMVMTLVNGMRLGIAYMPMLHRMDFAIVSLDEGEALLLCTIACVMSSLAAGFMVSAILRRAAYDCCFLLAAIVFLPGAAIGIAVAASKLWLIVPFLLAWCVALFIGARLGGKVVGRELRLN